MNPAEAAGWDRVNDVARVPPYPFRLSLAGREHPTIARKARATSPDGRSGGSNGARGYHAASLIPTAAVLRSRAMDGVGRGAEYVSVRPVRRGLQPPARRRESVEIKLVGGVAIILG